MLLDFTSIIIVSQAKEMPDVGNLKHLKGRGQGCEHSGVGNWEP